MGHPFALNIEKATLDNNAYRRVIWTGTYQQLVLMSLNPQEYIDMEIHPNTDQFFRLEQGNIRVRVSKNSLDKINFIEYHLKNGDIIEIPRNHYHEIYNEGSEQVKLYTIYSPPHHISTRLDITKV